MSFSTGFRKCKKCGKTLFALFDGELCDECEKAEQEPCDDTISRSDMLDAVGHGTTYTSEEVQKIVNNLPPVRPQEPKTGHWVRHDTGHSIYYDCSRCNCIAPCTETADAWLWKLSNYCPDCGAKMVEPKESEMQK